MNLSLSILFFDKCPRWFLWSEDFKKNVANDNFLVLLYVNSAFMKPFHEILTMSLWQKYYFYFNKKKLIL